MAGLAACGRIKACPSLKALSFDVAPYVFLALDADARRSELLHALTDYTFAGAGLIRIPLPGTATGFTGAEALPPR